MSRRDPYLAAAGLVLRHLAKPGSPTDAVDQVAYYLVRSQSHLERTFRQLQKARNHGWLAAAALKRCQLLSDAYEVQRKVAGLTQGQYSGQSDRPQSLPDIHADLRQLEDEFEAVELRLKERIIAVHTDAITLKGVALGPFSIELHLERLRQPYSSSFDCVALEPNRADSNSSVTHPHVSNNSLCAGDATVPLSTALKEGRIADAFCLVNAVLHQYNPGSPHVSLDNWRGKHCEECDGLTNPDSQRYCQGCDRRCCNDCTHTCAGCDETFCTNCLEQDPEVEEPFCSKCRRRCANCNRIVGLKHCDKETDLCRDCLDAQQDEPAPDNLPKEPHEQAERQSLPVPAGG